MLGFTTYALRALPSPTTQPTLIVSD